MEETKEILNSVGISHLISPDEKALRTKMRDMDFTFRSQVLQIRGWQMEIHQSAGYDTILINEAIERMIKTKSASIKALIEKHSMMEHVLHSKFGGLQHATLKKFLAEKAEASKAYFSKWFEEHPDGVWDPKKETTVVDLKPWGGLPSLNI